MLAILATCPASATVIDWAQWTVTSTGTTGTATGSTSGHGTFTGVFTGQTTTFTLPAASSFGLSAFTTVSPPKQFYGILESPTQAGALRDTFDFTGLTGAGTDKLIMGIADLKYDTAGPFNGPTTLTLTAFDLANNPISLASVVIREQKNQDPLIASLLNGQDLSLTHIGVSAQLEVNPFDNTRSYSHSLTTLLDGFPTGIAKILAVHANPDTSFIDGMHMGFGVAPEPSSMVLGLLALIGLVFVAAKTRRVRRRAVG